MLAEAAAACLYAGNPAEMLSVAERAWAQSARPARRSGPASWLGWRWDGRIFGGHAAAGAEALHEAVSARRELGRGARRPPPAALAGVRAPVPPRDRHRALPAGARAAGGPRSRRGRRAPVRPQPDRPRPGHHRPLGGCAATYQEAIGLARESGQQTQLVFGLAGLAWLQARRGREAECRACADEALTLCGGLGMRLFEVWAAAALGELELGLGDAGRAVTHLEHQQHLLADLAITDPDLSPAAELVDGYLKLGRYDDAQRVAAQFMAAADAKGQPWSVARALRCRAMLAEDSGFTADFERAIGLHDQTPDAFEAARTRLAYGERLRRSRNRVLARQQLRAAVDTFDDLDARPWADRARAELAATGETRRPRDASGINELTPQELQIALLLAGGKTTRETAAALFLSPKTVEYHLRHVYQRLGIHSRDELAERMRHASPVD